jgi:hypothetical protein
MELISYSKTYGVEEVLTFQALFECTCVQQFWQDLKKEAKKVKHTSQNRNISTLLE